MFLATLALWSMMLFWGKTINELLVRYVFNKNSKFLEVFPFSQVLRSNNFTDL